MANGQVTTGFSKPYVALYTCTNDVISYSDGQPLARGVEVNVEPESSEDNNFYADNQEAESDSGKFTGGTISLTVDGLLTAAERLVMGLPAATEGWMDYDDDQQIPEVGIGFIRRVMSGGVTSYIPYIIVRAVFSQIPINGATQEEEIDWQTTELSATLKRGQDAKHRWKRVGQNCQTEEAAEAMIQAALGITSASNGNVTEEH